MKEEGADIVDKPQQQKPLHWRQITVTVKATTSQPIPKMNDFRIPTYTLFDHPDQDESILIRLILAHSEVEYDTVYLADTDDYYGLPFRCVPMLELNGFRLANVNTICRHLAWRYDLSGQTADEDMIVDMVAEAIHDSKNRLRQWIRLAEYRDLDDYNMNELEAYAKDYVMHSIGPAIEEMLANSQSEWIVGKRMTWADLSIACLFNPIIFHRPSFFDRLPHLYHHCKRVADLFEGLLYNIRDRQFKDFSPCSSSSTASSSSFPSSPIHSTSPYSPYYARPKYVL